MAVAGADGKVDPSDLSIVMKNFGSAMSLWSDGNFDGSPTIDLTDLADVLNNFGAGLPADSVTTAPEPSSLMILAAGVLIARRRRR